MNKPKLIVPKHVWDTKTPEKAKKELEKVPQPTGFRMVLYPLKLESKTSGGLHLTDDTVEQSQIATNVCKVLRMGPSCYKDKQRFPDGPWCKEGNWVLITRYAGSRIKIDGGELRIVNDDEILALIEDPRDILPANIIKHGGTMPEGVTPSSEKLVPIDTSGNAVDVTLKEDKKDDVVATTEGDSPVVVVLDDNPVDGVENKPVEGKEEELEEYSASVKKRIDKLTRKMREAERREQAAVDYAKNVNEKYKNAVNMGTQKDDYSIKQIEDKLVTQEAFAKRAMEAAMQAGDVNKQVEAQQEIARLAIEKERVAVSKQKRERQKKQLEGKEFEGEPMPDILKSGGQPVSQELETKVDPKAQQWASKNSWFGKDKVMTYAAMGLHEELVEEGFDATTDEYYSEIDKRIKNRFPQSGSQSKPTQKVASAVRTSSAGRRTVRLTPSQVAIAKKLGVPLEEYAKHVKEA